MGAEITTFPIEQPRAGAMLIGFYPPDTPWGASRPFRCVVTPALEQVLANGGSSPLPAGAVVGPDGNAIPLPDGAVLTFGSQANGPVTVLGPDGQPVPLPIGAVLTLS